MAHFGYYGGERNQFDRRHDRPAASSSTSFEYGHGSGGVPDVQHLQEPPSRPLLDPPPGVSPRRRRSPSPPMRGRRDGYEREGRYETNRPTLLETPPPPHEMNSYDGREYDDYHSHQGREFDFPERRRARSRSPSLRSSGRHDLPPAPSRGSREHEFYDHDERSDRPRNRSPSLNKPAEPYVIDLEARDSDYDRRDRRPRNSERRYNDRPLYDDVIEVDAHAPPRVDRPPLLNEPDLYILPSEKTRSRSSSRSRRSPRRSTRALLPDPQAKRMNPDARGNISRDDYQYPDRQYNDRPRHEDIPPPHSQPLLDMNLGRIEVPQKSIGDVLGGFDVPRQDVRTQMEMEQTLFHSQALLNQLEQQDKAKVQIHELIIVL